jgi:L-serine dehydratase
MTANPAAPIQTTLDELFKIGPGPSSSHTMGPMRITYDYFRRVSALPAEVTARATGIEVHLYGSLSATGRGHGTDRASLAGLLGQSPAACRPEFLDGLATDPARRHTVDLGATSLDVGIASVFFEDPALPVPHPNTMWLQLLAGGARAVLRPAGDRSTIQPVSSLSRPAPSRQCRTPFRSARW